VRKRLRPSRMVGVLFSGSFEPFDHFLRGSNGFRWKVFINALSGVASSFIDGSQDGKDSRKNHSRDQKDKNQSRNNG
jgi:hypothetical protein